jgi:DNA (cytosine-5)-methyltransferase 1
MKILNLYAGIGGNRKNWGNNHEITAIENNEEIAGIYKKFFPKDKVIITDAHEYLLNHFKEFEFIWSSPPCPSHSRARFWGNKNKIYPDMKLYQEILFLKHYFKGKWCVENVYPYYKPLIEAVKIGRNLFWSNFNISSIEVKKGFYKDSILILQKETGFNLKEFKIKHRKDTILRNCVNPQIGEHILNCALKENGN